ncbi:Alpha/Beta hydrolase protein [Echria macrotheca]|uniref:Alpha/Beta hydrolase protein n=1 Tax=Echria macrotheca TaxID=438768 RepID=A0AAJ0B4J4_9PEZI|nr:Alpha/Beta hydrolase protein [Echria macrotheca]
MPVPFLGRLHPAEYVALIGSFLLVGLEAIIRVLTLALPPPLIQIFYRISRRLFNRFTSPAQKRAEERRKSVSVSVRDASDFTDLCALWGYTAEEHVVQTKDGYLLGLHRLAWRKGEEDVRVNRGPRSVKKRVIYLHHGLLMNSEVWVCLTDEQRTLPFVLVERGFDVWLGNNRGNKYSKKSIKCPSTSLEFWNFSIDEFAFHDIPDSISYILETTGQPSLSYIGFSQGTAQAFASLAVHPKLNDQVNVFIALAPAMSPAGLHNGIVDALVKASPQVLYLLFGRRSILSSATMWQSILYPPIFSKMIDLGLGFLFNWKTKNISTSQKLAAYPHLYSFTSTKSVVHWFQIIRNKSFQMYDDDVQPPLLLSSSSKYTKIAKYPTRNIKTPVVLVYGGSDSLVDIKVMLRELPSQTMAIEIPHYEHLDFLWARDVDTQVFQHVFDALESFTGAEHTKEEYERYRNARHSSLNASSYFRRRTQRGSDAALDSDVSTAVDPGSVGEDGAVEPMVEHHEHAPTEPDANNEQETPAHKLMNHVRESYIPSPSHRAGLAKPRATIAAAVVDEDDFGYASPLSPESTRSTGDTATGADRSLDRENSNSSPRPPRRRGTGGSHMSVDSMKGGKGISLGAST